MTEKSKKKKRGSVDKEKLHQLKKHFNRADKENIGEISKDDWFETLTAAGLHVEMADVEALFEAQDRDLDGKLSWEGLWSLGHIWLGWLWQKRWGQWCDGDDDDDDDDGYEGNDGDGDGDNNDDNEDDGDNRDDDDYDDDDDDGYGDDAFAMSEFCGEQTATERAFLLLDPDRDGKISKQVHIC